VIPAIELAAVIASGTFGVLRGLRAGFDLVGLLSLAAAAAFGGGTLRDLFLDRRPLFWVEREELLWVVFGLSLIGGLAPRWIARTERFLLWPDALGLGLFSVAGTAVAVDAGMSPVIAAVMGVVTGTFGGVICDVVCNETPSLFRSSPLEATCALLGAVVYLAIDALTAVFWAPQAAGIAAASALRLVAVWRDWRLPVRSWSDTPDRRAR